MPLWKILVIAGILLIFLGLLLSGNLGPLGHLPGDILVEKENVTFYFPITTMILVSLVVSLLLRFL